MLTILALSAAFCIACRACRKRIPFPNDPQTVAN
jgi:hypothetical protein